MAGLQEVFEGALDLEGGGVWGLGREGGCGDGFGGAGDNGIEVLGQELTMEGVGAPGEQVGGGEAMGASDGEMGEIGIGGQGLDVE